MREEGKRMFYRNTAKYLECVDDIRSLLQENDDILVIPGAEVLHIYYDGKPIGTAKNSSWGKYPYDYNKYFTNSGCMELKNLHDEVVKSKNKKSIYLDKNKLSLIKKGIDKGLARDKERKSQQIIALASEHQTFDENKYSICGMETTIPKEMLVGTNRRGGKQVEIDLVALCPQKREILLIEYKCTRGTTVDGITDSERIWNFDTVAKKEQKNIISHCKDYLAVLEMERLEEFVIGILHAFNFMAQLNGKEMLDIGNQDLVNEYVDNLRILFLLTNEPKKDCVCEKKLVAGTYETVKRFMRSILATYRNSVISSLTLEDIKQQKFSRNSERIMFYAEKKPELVNLNNDFVTLEQLKYPQ